MIDPGAEKLIDLLFKEGEEVCVSPTKYAFRSIKQEDLRMGSFELTSNDGQSGLYCNPSDIKLMAINPIKGPREDANCTAFRSFMVEMDDGSLREQYAYVSAMRMPYSAVVFSGGKSLHFIVTLTEDLPSLDTYNFVATWILKIMEKADQSTKNPSRSVRFPGTMRDGKQQKLLEIKSKVTFSELTHWLNKFPGHKPVIQKKTVASPKEADLLLLPEWVQNELTFGIDETKGRNNRWFAIAYECGLQGFSEDDTIIMLEYFFNEDRDFKRREWLTTIRSGLRKANGTR
jgi:hypothetical protein